MDERRGLFEELKRRNVFRAVGMSLVVAWLLFQVGETTFDAGEPHEDTGSASKSGRTAR